MPPIASEDQWLVATPESVGVPQMVRQGAGGSIINVASQLAEVARPERAAYVASKGRGRSLTHAIALELAPHGIRVNAIARPDPDRTDPRKLR